MSTSADRRRLQRLIILLVGLMLILQFPGEPIQAAAPQTTTISLQMSNPSCVEAQPASGVCSLQFAGLTATGSDTSFSRVEVLVNGKLRVLMAGFFESTAYLSAKMLPGGLLVPCGRPNDGGQPNYGRSYLLAANAYMVDGTSASNSMTVFCPAYDGRTYLPLLRKK